MTKHQLRVGRNLIYGLLDPRDRCLRYIGKTHKRREIRLAEHLELAELGDSQPLYIWMQQVLDAGHLPEIFVLERLPGEVSWREAEKKAIASWRKWPASDLPYTHPPQTRKSNPVLIQKVDLLNIRDGG